MSDDALSPDALRDAVRAVLADRAARGDRIPGDEGRAFDADLWQEMAALGWLALPVDAASGGLALGAAHTTTLFEELGGVLASVPALGTILAADFLDQDRLPSLVAGELRVALGEDAIALDGDRASGHVAAMLDAADADLLVLPAGDDALAIVAAGAPGVAVAPIRGYDLTRRLADVTLDRTPVEIVRLDATARATLADRAALAIAADSIGGARAILSRTIDYLKMRTQFGRAIGSFQALKHRAAHWQVQLDAAAALVRHAAAGGPAWRASAAKALAADTYAAIAEDAIQLHGGIGFTWEHVCHMHLRRAKLNQVLFGSSRDHSERVARCALAADAEEDCS